MSVRASADNTLRSATNLGLINDKTVGRQKAVGVNDKDDLYRFRVSGRSSVEINLTGLRKATLDAGSNVDIQLFRLKRSDTIRRIGTKNYSQLTATEIRQNFQIIRRSIQPRNRSESINLNLNGGEYFIRVYQRAGNTNYRMRVFATPDGAGQNINSARNITVNETPASFVDYVGKSDPSDVYKFSLGETRNVNFGLANLVRNADLQLLNASGEIISSSSNLGTANESITTQLGAGTYHLRVLRRSVGTKYTLNAIATLPPVIPPPGGGGTDGGNPGGGGTDGGNPGGGGTTIPLGDSITNPIQLNQIGPALTNRTGTVNDTSPNDYYKFTVPAGGPSDFSLLLKGLTANADIEILNSAGAPLNIFSRNSGTQDERLRFRLNPGDYFIRVHQNAPGQATNYTLDLFSPQDKYGNSTSTATAIALSDLNLQQPTIFSDYAGGPDEDFFTFTLDQRSEFKLSLNGLTENLDVQLFAEGATGSILTSAQAGNAAETLSGILESGVKYYVRVYPGTAGALSTYELEMTANPNLTLPAISRDIFPGGQRAEVEQITSVGGSTIYFSAVDENGRGLWKSNGTLDTTIKIAQFRGGLSDFADVNGTLYFAGNAADTGSTKSLWRVVKGANGVETVEEVSIAVGEFTYVDPKHLTKVEEGSNFNLYFVATRTGFPDDTRLFRATNNNGGLEITEVSGAGINPDGDWQLTNVNGTLYFTGYEPGGFLFKNVYRIDAATPGTAELAVTDFIDAIDRLRAPQNLTAIGSSLFFVDFSLNSGTELWRIDSNGVPRPFELNNGDGDGIFGNDTSGWRIAQVGNSVYFSGKSSTSNRMSLWQIDLANNDALTEIPLTGTGNIDPLYLTSFNNKLYFTANNGTDGRELWIYDPNATGNKLSFRDINSGELGSTPQDLTVSGNTLYFTADDGIRGRELWGITATGVEAFDGKDYFDINPGINGSDPTNLVDAGGRLFFVANDGVSGTELWGTALTTNQNPGTSL